MKSLKKYLQDNCKDLVIHLEEMEQLEKESVYNERKRPDNAIRIWLSYDIDNDDENKTRHAKLGEWLRTLNAESWGNSVASFVIDLEADKEPTNESVAKWIVEQLQPYKIVLDGTSFDEEEWKKTKDISLYVIYRYKTIVNKEEICNSNHFVLIHNATITHINGF